MNISISMYFLLAILLIASVWDAAKFVIPNWLTLFGMMLGIGFSSYLYGWEGLGTSLLGIVVIFLVFLPAWMFFGMGAGDVKLLMVVGSFIGFGLTLLVGFDSLMISAVMFLFIIPKSKIKNMFRDYFYLLFYKIPLLSDKGPMRKLPFAVIIFAAFSLRFYIVPLVKPLL